MSFLLFVVFKREFIKQVSVDSAYRVTTGHTHRPMLWVMGELDMKQAALDLNMAVTVAVIHLMEVSVSVALVAHIAAVMGIPVIRISVLI